jgi:hypothetical protein
MELVTTQIIESRIFTIRGVQVMLDRDLSDLYQVETRILNQAVKRNIDRFPEKFRFQLTEVDIEILRSQIVTLNSSNQNLKSQIVISSEHGGRRYLPYAFTEQGVAMLSGILKSEKAVKINILIMRAFVNMRKFISSNMLMFQKLDNVERKQIEYQLKTINYEILCF